MLKKRIIPCLDIKNGRTVKGINFVNLRDAGDPVALATKYMMDGADELVFLDITATVENRSTLIDLVQRISRDINIPFTVGGGIRAIKDAEMAVQAGADKVSINSAAILDPVLVNGIAKNFGSQSLTVAMDIKKINGEWKVCSNGGRIITELKVIDWVTEVVDRGAGEILLTVMDNDGLKNGFSLEITGLIAEKINIPVIASGGAGSMEHFKDLFETTKATGGLAASIFHYGEVKIPDLKKYLFKEKIPVRCI
ncbi:MAG: imidazole glycerol phosphate synthase subunit HisF [Saprospiraceae bacterium]|jgi:cyclase|nr:imidazole glycerol phosphate synthase subunit HisF [Candidatus Brachybacter algidus]MBK6372862.1 imidazole glycerol phosphate synthase subunit HisF [Candidatus Brachybacter algidus]MBK8601975.1 imidazole glycerol phosphate synthase subunit HisF [Candidatus Brachybacter algidus]MBK8749413.1 imidazole glycerol phosphate synthase subunit HisF [Candidatus Brachybacter algidus]